MKITKKYYEWNDKQVERDCELPTDILEYVLDAIEKENMIAIDGVVFLSKDNSSYKEECRAMLAEIQQNIEKWVMPNYFSLEKLLPGKTFEEKCRLSLENHTRLVKWVEKLAETV